MLIYNTLTRRKEEFIPTEKGKVKMFVCGPTVYDYIHVGNARTYTVFDVVAKYLRYEGFDVEYIQNITDIDDKIIKRALELNIDPADLAKDYTDAFLEDIKKLGIDSVSHYEPATKNIDEVIKQVKVLIDKGNAYKIDGDGWYFDLKTFPEYGKLSGRTAGMAEDGVSRIDESPDKKNRGDFALWKFSKPEEPGWDSDLGYGRPGWHIEDTSITEKFFGPQYDLHGAGIDLMFPHHEAEIAQQESASGLKPFVRYWMHAGFLVNKTQKMSKSTGNFMVLREALKQHRPEVLRFYFLSSHYRASLDYNEDLLKQSEAAVNRLAEFVRRLTALRSSASQSSSQSLDGPTTKSLSSSATKSELITKTRDNFKKEMDDDFNTPKAVAVIFDLIREVNPLIDEGKVGAEEAQEILGLLGEFNQVLSIIPKKTEKIPEEVQKLVDERETARQAKDYSGADKLRKKITDLGYEVEDTNFGPLVRKLS